MAKEEKVAAAAAAAKAKQDAADAKKRAEAEAKSGRTILSRIAAMIAHYRRVVEDGVAQLSRHVPVLAVSFAALTNARHKPPERRSWPGARRTLCGRRWPKNGSTKSICQQMVQMELAGG